MRRRVWVVRFGDTVRDRLAGLEVAYAEAISGRVREYVQWRRLREDRLNDHFARLEAAGVEAEFDSRGRVPVIVRAHDRRPHCRPRRSRRGRSRGVR